MTPLVRIQAGDRYEDFTDYLVCSFYPALKEFTFRVPYNKDDTRLSSLITEDGTDILVTVFEDETPTTPKLKFVGKARYFIVSNLMAGEKLGLIQDVTGFGEIELL